MSPLCSPLADNKEIIRNSYSSKVGLSAAKTGHRICQAFENSVVNTRTARHWFKKSRSDGLSLCDEHRSRRPQALDNEALQATIEDVSILTCGELAREFNVSN